MSKRLMSRLVSGLMSLVPAPNPRKKSNGRVSAQPQNDKTRKVQAMSKIKNTKQFKEQVDAAFTTMQTRDEAKACVRGRDAKPLGVYPLDPWGSDP